MIAQNQTTKVKNQIGFLIDFFLENQVEEINIKFKEPQPLKEEELKEILGYYNSSNGVYHNGRFLEEYVYDEDNGLAKIFIEYDIGSDGKLEIYEISMWREKLE